ncbi:Trm112 family protein [Utexia brackfieldae]|uniref:Trm112 family protein n=1 Tax=Utexia brackfieldae TaxID=3074108 RepID=UPI00370D3D0F
MDMRLLDAVVCPKCCGKLEYDKNHHQLICHDDKLVYNIDDGIPVLLESKAVEIQEERA